LAQTSEGQTVRVPEAQRRGGLDGYFEITERGSTTRTEIIAGFTTFLTMAYILFLNPQILSLAGADREGTILGFAQLLTVTALVAGIATLAMGIYARYPFAIASGLGLNAFVAFTLVIGRQLTWPEAMGVIVIEGLVITVLVLTGFREAVLNAIPKDLKLAIGIGIGLFLVIIGLVNAGVVIPGQGTVLTITSDFTSLRMLVFAVGLMTAAVLTARGTRGGLLISIVVATIVGIVINELWANDAMWATLPGVGQVPSDVIASPDFSLVGNFNFGVFAQLGFLSAIVPIFAVMLSDFFDTMGTAVALGEEAGLLDRDGRLPEMKRVLLVDSLAAAAGGAASASSNTTFIESASGIGEGGRTGLASVVTGVLFLLCLFISPIAGVIPPEATASVLIVVGYFMLRSVVDIDWRDPAIGIPALLTIALMPFTYSITNGVGAGFLTYTVIKVFQGKFRDVHPLMYVISAAFLFYFLKGVLA
jgi:AGZA family xanthine/uracil permease-like MFS transporter